MNSTFLEFISSNERGSCGYCKNIRGERTRNTTVKESAGTGDSSSEEVEESSLSHSSMTLAGVWAHKLRVNDYSGLLDMGWRRSGCYLYKPHNSVTCCPQFTIRLDVTKFKMSRSQKRAMRQMNEFLATGKRPVCGIKEEDAAIPMKIEQHKTSTLECKEEAVLVKQPAMKKEKDPDRPVLTKKEIRNKRFEEKCRTKNLDPEVIRDDRRHRDAQRQRTIQSYIDEARPDWKHKLEVKLVGLGSDDIGERDNESFDLYKKYQHTIHKDESCRLAGFRRFLCDSPLEKEQRGRIELGSFHLWFLLDGKLIAVSVIDILPNCLSAKYMYYDPDYAFLSLGTYTALREIEQTQRLEKICSNLKFYYMGYYIHSCPKMRYKAKFRPSDLLCDQSLRWLDFESCRKFLDETTNTNGFAEFYSDVPRPASPPVNGLRVFSKGAILTFERALVEFPLAAEDDQLLQRVRDIAHLVGPHLGDAVYYFSEFNS